MKVRLRRQLFDYIIGLGFPHQLDVRVDRQRVFSTVVGGEDKGTPPPASYVGNLVAGDEWEDYALGADKSLEVRFKAHAGTRVIGLSFLARPTEREDGVQPPLRSPQRDESLESNPWIQNVDISGPYNPEGPGDTSSRRRIFVCKPTSSQGEQACAREILTKLAKRAYRRPPVDDDLAVLMAFYDDGRKQGSFEGGIQFALERILADPKFLFRVEQDSAGAESGSIYRLSDLELASRLSFFLWSSIPDDELLDLAIEKRLGDPAILELQVRRMLRDDRAKALTENFVGQWLGLRDLKNAAPDLSVFANFSENLREDFKRETELFVNSVLRADRSVVDLLTANYTFVNERLARHYGISGVAGGNFRKVTFEADSPRGGLIGQASLLTINSYPNRTSPVLRGHWVLESLLGTPPPPPPANVPSLPDKGQGGKAASVRERLEQHRKSPYCATCHATMDPLGFALEGFDAVGALRRTENGQPVDDSAQMPGGTPFRGPAGLRTYLASQSRQVVTAMTEKLQAYAVGRSLDYYDSPSIRQIVRDASAEDYKWSALVLGIVKSPSVPDATRSGRCRAEARSGGTLTHSNASSSGGGEPNMIISKMSLHRRTFLRGLGATVALPFLDAMVPALTAMAKTAAAPVRRFGVVYVPNGIAMDSWTPSTTGAFETTPILRPVEAFKERMLVFSGLDGVQSGGGTHTIAATRFLTGTIGSVKEHGIEAGISIDQMAAKEFGKHTQLASLELSLDRLDLGGTCDSTTCAFINSLSWATPTMQIPGEDNPRVVFERLFGDSGTTESHGTLERHQAKSQCARLCDALGVATRDAARSVGPRTARGVSDRGSRRRAPHPESRGTERDRAASGGAAGWHPRQLRRPLHADVRSAAAGLSVRLDARIDVHDGTRGTAVAHIRR